MRSKRWWTRFLVMMALMALVVTPVWAQESVRIVVNGLEQPAISAQADIVNGRVMVPVDLIPILFAGAVLQPSTGISAPEPDLTIAHKNTVVHMTLGGQRALVNDRIVLLDAPLTEANGTWIVPLAFLATAFGEPIRWDGANHTVYLGLAKPNMQPPVGIWPPNAQQPLPTAPRRPIPPTPPRRTPPPAPAPDVNQMLDQATLALRMLPKFGPAGKLDPAALDLIMKSQSQRNANFTGTYQLNAEFTEDGRRSHLEFSGEIAGAMRGQEMLVHMTQLPFGISMAVREGQVWVKLPGGGWQNSGAPPMPGRTNATATPVKPEKIEALVRAAVAAGLADVTMAPVRSSDGRNLPGATLRIHADAVLKLARTFLPGRQADEFNHFMKSTGLQIDDPRLTVYMAADGVAIESAFSLGVRFHLPDSPGQAYAIQFGVTSTATPANGPMPWPRDLIVADSV